MTIKRLAFWTYSIFTMNRSGINEFRNQIALLFLSSKNWPKRNFIWILSSNVSSAYIATIIYLWLSNWNQLDLSLAITHYMAVLFSKSIGHLNLNRNSISIHYIENIVPSRNEGKKGEYFLLKCIKNKLQKRKN